MNGGSVLMVEPNPGILIVARNVLARAGYGVLAVSNARQGVKLVEQRRIEVVLLDAKQASADVLRNIAECRRPQVQVILTVQKGRDVMTLDTLGRIDGPTANVSDVLEKPFTPERLLGAVDRALDRWSENTDPPQDTLINVDAMPFEEEPPEGARTDIFPFAHLLQQDVPSNGAGLFDDETKIGIAVDAKGARRAALIRNALESDRPDLDPTLLTACVRACEAALEQEDLQPAEEPADHAGSLVVAGYVGHLAIDQILQIPSAVDGPARCRLEHDGAAIDILYDGPRVVFARHDNLPDGFMLGRLLIASGLVTEEEVEAAMDPRRGLKGWLGQRLLRAGLVTEEGLNEALRKQTQELVYEVVRWRSGRFSVFANEALPPQAERARLSIPVQHLLLEGMRRLDEWRRIEGEVGDLGAVLRPLAASHAEEILLGLSPEDRLVLAHVDGQRTVAELVQSVARPSFEVFRALHSLAGQKLVAVGS